MHRLIVLLAFFLVLVHSNSERSTIDDPEFQRKFQVEILKRGNHDLYANQGDNITFHYHGRNPNGEIYDSSFNRRQPYTFQLGSLGVIRCWNEAMKRMTLGDRIKVVCPSKYAYGKHGLGPILPSDTPAHLEIELLGINDEKLSEDYIDDL